MKCKPHTVVKLKARCFVFMSKQEIVVKINQTNILIEDKDCKNLYYLGYINDKDSE